MSGDEIRLVIKRHGLILDERVVDQDRLSVGRAPECDVVLDDPSTSRRVAIFRREAGELWIEDTGSLEGVRVNGEIVEKLSLCNGDQVDVGPFVIEIDGASLPTRGMADAETVERAAMAPPIISTAGDTEPAVSLLMANDRTVELPEGRFILGRGPECDVVVDADAASKRHAELEVGASRVTIRDLGSTNGINVNGRKVSEHVLCDGDRIELGDEPIAIALVGPGLATAAMTTTPSSAAQNKQQPGRGGTIFTGADLLDQQARVAPAAKPAPAKRVGKGRLILRLVLVVFLTFAIGIVALLIMAPDPPPAAPETAVPATTPPPAAEPASPPMSAEELYRAGVRSLQQDRIQETVDLWEQSLALDPQAAEVVDAYGALLYHVGYVYEGDGQLDKARQTWERLVDTLSAHAENQYVIKARVRLRRLQGN